MATDFSIAFIFILTLLLRTHSALQIDINPPTFTEERKGPVNISCRTDTLDAGSKDTYLIEIEKDGERPFVFHSKGGSISYGSHIDASRFQADGHIDSDTTKTYLNVSLMVPNNDDSGVYMCKMFYIDESGLMKERRASGDLTVDLIDIHKAVRRLLMENSEMKQQLKEMSALKLQLKDVSELKQKLEEQTSKVTSLENRTQQQADEIKYLQDQNGWTSAFSAALTDVTPPTNSVLVFPDVIMRQGLGYNKTSGVYTAPVAGLYVFHLVLRSDIDCCSGTFSIQVNDRIVATLQTLVNPDDKYKRDQSSVSTVAELKDGDEVKVTVITDNTHLNGRRHNTFTGYLIKAMKP